MATKVREYDVGVTFLVTLVDADENPLDVSTATAVQFRFRKSSGTEVVKTGSLFASGTDGKVKYTTVAGDLDEVGGWSFQARVVLSGGSALTSEAARFRVEDAIALP